MHRTIPDRSNRGKRANTSLYNNCSTDNQEHRHPKDRWNQHSSSPSSLLSLERWEQQFTDISNHLNARTLIWVSVRWRIQTIINTSMCWNRLLAFLVACSRTTSRTTQSSMCEHTSACQYRASDTSSTNLLDNERVVHLWSLVFDTKRHLSFE